MFIIGVLGVPLRLKAHLNKWGGKMKIEIDNPCYHCYTGAVGYCRETGCKYEHYSWSEDLETDYKVEYDDEDDKE